MLNNWPNRHKLLLRSRLTRLFVMHRLHELKHRLHWLMLENRLLRLLQLMLGLLLLKIRLLQLMLGLLLPKKLGMVL